MIAFSSGVKPQSVKSGAAAMPTSPATRPGPSRRTSISAASSISQPPIDDPTNNTGDRKSVVSGKSVSVRVELGGRRLTKKQITSMQRQQQTYLHETT